MGWRHSDSLMTKKCRVQNASETFLASDFWNAQGLIKFNFLENDRTITVINCSAFLTILREKVYVDKMQRILFWQDNAYILHGKPCKSLSYNSRYPFTPIH